ncbi:MAG: hypothetical protein ACFCUW_03465 [Kiloniellaceae bacterium]
MPRKLLHGSLIAVLLALGAAVPQAVAQGGGTDAYVEGIPDLPLMPGLKALPDSGLVFDKPGGRIVEAFAEGSLTPESVRSFYDQTLPQLGWQREGTGAYLREGERLNLDLSEDARGITVHFRLFPQ